MNDDACGHVKRMKLKNDERVVHIARHTVQTSFFDNFHLPMTFLSRVWSEA